ncbi:MAG TPA: hypothetical protein VHV51_21260 [Polyangiaceae bacterium]|nr:hypothetical protein [Polyangiaceae bacterium]
MAAGAVAGLGVSIKDREEEEFVSKGAAATGMAAAVATDGAVLGVA